MEETHLLKALQKGDNEAYRQLLEQHGDSMFRTALGFVGDHDSAKEIVQLSLIKVYKNIHGFDHRSKLKTWLYRVTCNTSLDYLKSAKRRKTEELTTEMRDRSTFLFESESTTQVQEQTEILYRAIKQLPDMMRKAIILQKMEELSVGEIAEILDTTVAAVDSYLFRAKKKLKEIIQDILKDERN